MWSKISGKRGHPHQPSSVSQNQMHRSFLWCKNVGIGFFRFIVITHDGRSLTFARSFDLEEARAI